MYENFGAKEIGDTKKAGFKLFVPDSGVDPDQYEGGGLPRIVDVFVVGSFQNQIGTQNWQKSAITKMDKEQYKDKTGRALGWLYYFETPGTLNDGFYEYKYLVSYENAEPRMIGDPCSKYGGSQNQNAGFTIGGKKMKNVISLNGKRLHLKDLIIYELMIDNFTESFANGRAPLDVLKEKLDYLVNLGVNAIEFMPWTAWANEGFSWGYNPYQYFSVAHRYTLNPQVPENKIIYLKELISLCHEREIHVIMDGVFNHAESGAPYLGFAYYWLYQDTADSPYVGNFAAHDYFQDLDYQNDCTLQFILDVCKYWIDEFKVDGIRFDNTSGFYKPEDRAHGLSKLLSELRAHLSETGNKNFAIILEHSWDYDAIDVVNKVGATSCWFDPFRSRLKNYLEHNYLDGEIMRLLNSATDFELGRVPVVYIENHDHTAAASSAGGRSTWWKTQPFAIALFTIPGAPLIHNGQEFGEDYWMPEPGYEEDKSPIKRIEKRPLRWERLYDEPGQKLQSLYKQLIKMRKEHRGLRSTNFYPHYWEKEWGALNENGFGVDVMRKIVVYHRWGEADDGQIERFYIVLNFSDKTQNVKVQFAENGLWKDLLSQLQLNVTKYEQSLDVSSHWGHVFYKKG